MAAKPEIFRLAEKFTIGDGCWVWTGARAGWRSDKGLGYGKLGRPNRYAHRVMYEMFVGPIPDGFTIDHLCRNTLCVRPDHLEAVTIRENIQRGSRAKQTHCKHGHQFTTDNTYVKGNGCRACKACMQIRDDVRVRTGKVA